MTEPLPGNDHLRLCVGAYGRIIDSFSHDASRALLRAANDPTASTETFEHALRTAVRCLARRARRCRQYDRTTVARDIDAVRLQLMSEFPCAFTFRGTVA